MHASRNSGPVVELNLQFYQSFGPAFAATRRRIQPGVRRILASLPTAGRLAGPGLRQRGAGGGVGTIAGAQAATWGWISAPELLEEARRGWPGRPARDLSSTFEQAHLSEPEWPGKLLPADALT